MTAPKSDEAALGSIAIAGEPLDPAADIGAEPQMRWLPVESLEADPAYQRNTNTPAGRALVRRIVENFHWTKFQPLQVAPIPDHPEFNYRVIDGLHRLAAARLHPKVKLVPCWVVPASTQRQEAGAFVAVNRDRVKIGDLPLHRALLAAGDPDALHVDDVCRRSGVAIAPFVIASSRIPPRTTLAIKSIKAFLRDHGDRPVVFALSALSEAFPTKPGQIRAALIGSIVRIEVQHRGHAEIDRARLVDCLRHFDAETLLTQAGETAKMLGVSREAATQLAIVRKYNRGLAPARHLQEPNGVRTAPVAEAA